MKSKVIVIFRSALFGVILLASSAFVVSGAPQRVDAQVTETSKLTIRVVDAKNSRGQIAIAIFKGPTGFPGNKTKALRTVQVAIDPKSLCAQVTVPDLPHADYGVAIFHDENMNGQLDKNMLGIPKEGYGFSNISKKSMGAPKFDDAKFQLVQPEQTLEIKLLY